MLMVDLRFMRRERNKSPDMDIEQDGFTIVELMMATLVFSVIMLVAAGAVVRFTTNFQRSVTATNTQAAARSVIDSISQNIQFGGGDIPTALATDGTTGWCVGDETRYSYVYGKQLNGQTGDTSTRYALVEDSTGTGCYGKAQDVDGTGTIAGQELLGANMRLVKFNIVSNNTYLGVWDVTIRVVYGDDELICSPSVPNSCSDDINPPVYLTSAQLQSLRDLQCRPGKGSQYCAVTELKTTVKRRV